MEVDRLREGRGVGHFFSDDKLGLSESGRQKAPAVVKFARVLKEVLWCLVTEGSISYRRIKLSYGLDDAAVEELRRELISTKRLAADVDGERLVWAPGKLPSENEPSSLSRQPLPPLRDSAPAPPLTSPGFAYEAQVLIPYISNGPLISWLYPVFGIRGASWFLGVSEWLFGALLFLGFWNKRLGILGAIGSTVTFVGTVTIIPFMPNGWDPVAGFPATAGNVPFLMKDVVLLAVSIYLLKQDVERVLEAGARTDVALSQA